MKDMGTEKCLQLCYWTEGLLWAVSACILRGRVLSIIDWKWNFSSSVNGHLQCSFSSFLVTIYVINQERLMRQGSVLMCIWTHAVFRNISYISNYLCCMCGHIMTHLQHCNGNVEQEGHYHIWQLWIASSCQLFYYIKFACSANCPHKTQQSSSRKWQMMPIR